MNHKKFFWDWTPIDSQYLVDLAIFELNFLIVSFSLSAEETKIKIGLLVPLTGDNSKIGNFVETKKSKIDKNSKVNHLSYIGDASIGKNSNIGAGTITCNYDGIKKSKTNISDNVFIGSNSSLVAPVKIDKGGVVGAGSVITKNVKKKTLALTRASQIEIKNYKRKKKK